MIEGLDLGRLSALSHLPQHDRLTRLLPALWEDATIKAVWLGGSLARDAGDPYSDTDLRIAVLPDAFNMEMPAGAASLQAAAAGQLTMRFDDSAVLFHMLLTDGTIYDLWVQTTERPPAGEARLVLGCRDDAFGERLRGGEDPVVDVRPVDPVTVRDIIITFWIGQQKHQKTLHRDLLLVAWQGETLLRQLLMRLWYIDATGNDCGPLDRASIHALAPVARTIQQSLDARAMGLAGLPARSPDEFIESTTQIYQEVARVGRSLATRLGFEYPVALERVVRQSWETFRQELSKQERGNERCNEGEL